MAVNLQFWNHIKPGRMLLKSEICEILEITPAQFERHLRPRLHSVRDEGANYYASVEVIQALDDFMKEKTLPKLASDAGLVPGRRGIGKLAFKRKWQLNVTYVRNNYNVLTEAFSEKFINDNSPIHELYRRAFE